MFKITVWIPKPDGGERPLGILTIEDKIVQRGTANILNAIYDGFAGNTRAITKFHFIVVKLWFKWLNRRSQKRSFTWEEFNKMLERYPLVKPKIVKTYAWIYS
mgnify:CR=1 FL=1